MFQLFVFTGLISLIAASAIQQVQPRMFRPCRLESANYGPSPLTNTIVDCDEFPCLFTRGTTATGIVEFNNPTATSSLTVNVAFEVGSGVGIYPLPDDQVNACLSLQGTSCPLDANEDVTHVLSMPVLYEYPPETFLVLEVSLRNADYQVVMCYQADFVVV